MTTLQSVVRRRRAVAAAGAVSAGLLVLSGCSKPTPVASLTVGGNTVHSEALCYNDGKNLTAASLKTCAKKVDEAKAISLSDVDTLRIGVDPKIADAGWAVLINGQPFINYNTSTYRTLPSDAFFNSRYNTGGDTNSVVIQMGSKATQGVWSFKVKKKA
ncbi:MULTISPECIES: DUF2771 domain-containing protein [Streptomyces]|uniref:DUF2771 domain-containing protein n=1 Tax=Streptomyces misionensis TaxID=67331 RepID=A0A1H4XNF9_9ACTN|nr:MULTISPECIES: DUF2771 domain-containing protein [Streptomyces]SED06264.1 hypothetical protein SAMN04490357_3703 [Streptomyces misionensis]SFY47091.1 hypothetical protein STEPF1_00297 [Streptomyces sp. F-1]